MSSRKQQLPVQPTGSNSIGPLPPPAQPLINTNSNLVKNIYTNLRTVDQRKLIKICGDQHRYQHFMLFSFIFICFLQTLFLLFPPFLFLVPDFSCAHPDSADSYICTLSEFCDPNNHYILLEPTHTFREHFHLMCTAPSFIPKLLSVILASSTLLTGPLFLLNSIIGPKMALVFISFLQIFACLLLLHTSSLHLATVCLAVLVSAALSWFFSAFDYLVESSGSPFRLRAYYAFVLTMSVSMILSGPLFGFFAQFQSLLVLLTVAGLCLTFFYIILVESPRYMRENFSLRRFYRALREIIRLNFSPSKAKRRTEALKVILFDSIDPSVQIVSSKQDSSLDSISNFVTSRVDKTKDDLDIVKNSLVQIKSHTRCVSRRNFDSNDRVSEKLSVVREQSPHPSQNLQAALFANRNFDQVDPQTRLQIYRLQLPFTKRSLGSFFSGSTVSQLLFSVFLLTCSAFLSSFFWFSLERLASGNALLNASVLSGSVMVGLLVSFAKNRELFISLSFLMNLLTSSFLLGVDRVRNVTTNEAFDSFTQSSFIFPVLFVYNLASAFAYFSTVRTVTSNFRTELKVFVNVVVLTTTLVGFSLAAFLTSLMLEFQATMLWAPFVMGVLALPPSFLFRFKSKEPFSRIHSPA